MEQDNTTKGEIITSNFETANSHLKWFPYYVRWHFKAVKGHLHAIKSKGFDSYEDAKVFYECVSKMYAKKLITPTNVLSYSDSWAQFIPSGQLPQPYMVSFYVSSEEDVVEMHVKYFDDETEATEYYNNIPNITAKKLTTPLYVTSNSNVMCIALA
jgi:hypothetical protein